MRLSDDILQNLLWSLGTEGPRPEGAGGGRELRRAPRVASRTIAMLFPITDGNRDEGREAAVRDISADGASLWLASPVRSRQFILQLPSQRKEPVSILCSVRHCDRCREGGWTVGAEFISFLNRAPGSAL